jgi:hypothetical protein
MRFRMQSIFVVVLVVSLACFCYAFAWECDGEWISEGDSKFKVLDTCGEPVYREIISGPGATEKIETFIYKELTTAHILTFKGDTLVKIEWTNQF